MHKEIQQIGAVGALILLLLGPSLGKLFHIHETSDLELCMHEGDIHFHSTDSHAAECFLCSFSFSSLQDKKEARNQAREFKSWSRSSSLYIANLHVAILSPHHAPRAPPSLLPYE